MRHGAPGTSHPPAGGRRAVSDVTEDGATEGARAGARAPQPPQPSRELSHLREELRRLRSVCERREIAFDHLLEATLALRRGTLALRDENRELRAELQRLRRRAA
jgi:hypothetical protein